MPTQRGSFLPRITARELAGQRCDAISRHPQERAAFAAGEAAVVEDVGDLGVGVVVEEVVDGGDDLGWGFAEQPGWFAGGQGQGVVLAAG
jgi:hypothetical protein